MRWVVDTELLERNEEEQELGTDWKIKDVFLSRLYIV